MRTALDDAAPLYRDAPEVTAAKAAGEDFSDLCAGGITE
jgi:hypothetical protein